MSKLLFIATVLLILAKVLPIYHIDFSDHLYFDIDRLIALLGFLIAYHYWCQSKFEIEPYLILVISGFLLSLSALLFDIAFERMFILFFMTALVEEILLRGVLFELLLKRISSVMTLLSTSLFFTLVHPAIYQDAIYAFAVLMTGLTLGGSYLYFRKQSRELAVVYTTVLHSLIILLGLKTGLI